MKRTNIKLAAVLVITLLFLAYALPNFLSKDNSRLLHLPKPTLRLGLDLKGGVHLVLNVKTEQAVDSIVNQTKQGLIVELPKQKIAYDSIKTTGQRVIVTLIDPADNQKAVSFLSNLTDYTIDSNGGKIITLTMKDKKALSIKKQAIAQSIEIIRNRVDQFGVVEPTIVKSGAHQITVDMP